MLKIIEKWLHSQKENGETVLEVLNDPTSGIFYFSSGDFRAIKSPITNLCLITDALNKYFITHKFLLEAHHKTGEYRGRIVQKFLHCKSCAKYITTESERYEHREHSVDTLVSRIEIKERPGVIFIEDEERKTNEKLKKSFEEERKASRDS